MYDSSDYLNNSICGGSIYSLSEDEGQLQFDQSELRDHRVKAHKVSKKFFNEDGTLNARGKEKLSRQGRVIINMTYTRKSFFGRQKTKTKIVSISEENLFKMRPEKRPSPFFVAHQERKDVAETPTGEYIEAAVDVWEECHLNQDLGDAVRAKFIDDVELAEEGQEAVSVTLLRQEGDVLEIGTVDLSVKSLASSLGVSENTVHLASENGDVGGLIMRARLTPDDQVENLNLGDGEALTQVQVKEVAIAVDGLRDEKLIFGKEVTEEGVLSQHEFGTPAHLELVDEKTGKIYAHIGKNALLGQGSFGVVSKTVADELGSSKTPGRQQVMVAQKVPLVVEGGENLLPEQIEEAKVGTKLAGIPFVMEVQSYTAFTDEFDQEQVSIVSELCTGGDLASLDEMGAASTNEKFLALEEPEKWLFFKQALAGVRGIHRRGYVHRDLKAPNILIAENGDKIEPRIADFGLVAQKGAKKKVDGSPNYIAPEHYRKFKNKEKIVKVSPENDAFAMGLVACELLLGIDHPAKQANGNPGKIINLLADLDEADWIDEALGDEANNYPPQLLQAVKGLCHGNPDKRISIKEAMHLIDRGVAQMK